MGPFDPQQPRFRVLRLALHTHPARQIVHHAVIEVVLAGVVVLLLTGLSLWQVRTLRQYLQLQADAARQDRLAALGGMAAVLAHEIRNPLGAIKGLAQFLTEKLTDHPTHTEMTQTIAKEATRLERLVNDLLTYARPRPPKRLSINLVDSLHQVLALTRPAADQGGVEIHLEAPDEGIPVHADSDQLQQLFSNLLLNGLQGMPQGGTLTISVARQADGAAASQRRAGGSGSESVAVRVVDTGVGIPDTDLPRIFEPFYTTRTQGTGLGLAICRQIVEAHGGTIQIERTGPQGTTMLVRLPMERAHD